MSEIPTIEKLENFKKSLGFDEKFIDRHKDAVLSSLLKSYENVSKIHNTIESIGLAYIAENLPMASALTMLGANREKLQTLLASISAIEKKNKQYLTEDVIATTLMYYLVKKAAEDNSFDSIQDSERNATWKKAADAIAYVFYRPEEN